MFDCICQTDYSASHVVATPIVSQAGILLLWPLLGAAVYTADLAAATIVNSTRLHLMM